jgi:alkylation response protein AidB-like acyl-CoA dehydrogenase
MTAAMPSTTVHDLSVADALGQIAAGAEALDRHQPTVFPHDAIDSLRRSGLLSWNAADGPRPPAQEEFSIVRAVAHADASVGRIYDGHLNGVERLLVQAPEATRATDLPAIRRGELVAGVWGGDPRSGEGEAARIERNRVGETLSGVKTFCSGAGGIDRALVLARDPRGDKPSAVWIDVSDRSTVAIDRDWYQSSGLRGSASYRVTFDRAPVIAHFGPPGALLQQPWFARDALRTAAAWAGMIDTAYEAAVQELRQRPRTGELEGLAAGRMLTARYIVDASLEHSAGAIDAASTDVATIALQTRAAISLAARTLLDEAARACGSYPFATGSALDRARRDLDVFLLQHRLDPMLAAAGERALMEQQCSNQ